MPNDPGYQRRYRAQQDPEKRRAYQTHRPVMLAKGARYREWRRALAAAAFTSAA